MCAGACVCARGNLGIVGKALLDEQLINSAFFGLLPFGTAPRPRLTCSHDNRRGHQLLPSPASRHDTSGCMQQRARDTRGYPLTTGTHARTRHGKSRGPRWGVKHLPRGRVVQPALHPTLHNMAYLAGSRRCNVLPALPTIHAELPCTFAHAPATLCGGPRLHSARCAGARGTRCPEEVEGL